MAKSQSAVELPPMSDHAPDAVRRIRGTVCSGDVIDKLPPREAYSRGDKLAVDETMRRNQNIQFTCVTVSNESWDFTYRLFMRGIGADGRTMLLYVDDVRPFLCVRKKEGVGRAAFESSIMTTLRNNFRGARLVDMEMAKRIVYYEFGNAMYAYIECENLNVFYKARDYFKDIATVAIDMRTAAWCVASILRPGHQLRATRCTPSAKTHIATQTR
jgi:hypothetical protein